MKPEDKLAEATLDKLLHGQYAEEEADDYLVRLRILTEAMHEYHEAKLKEELIKFLRYCERPSNPGIDNVIIQIVDEYLKQREDGDK